MLFRVLYWLPYLIKSMLYTLFLIWLFVALHAWILDVMLRISDNIPLNVYTITATTKPSTTRRPHVNTIQYNPASTVYILSWDHNYLTSVIGRFPKFNCSANCVYTTNKRLLNISAFNAIIFGENILTSENRPKRSPHQIFIFMSIESSSKFPACELYNEDFFNWTFTYRFGSDVLWRHFAWREHSGDIVAPSKQVIWRYDSGSLRPEIQSILRNKTRTVVWIVDNCSIEMYEYLLNLEKYLHGFALKLHKYKHIKKNSIYVDFLSRNYLFLLAFACDDPVSKKVLSGYRNYAVPVVYDGVIDYSRFLAPGSYINAYKTHPYNLALAIYEASKNPKVYENYFKWTNLYSIEEHTSFCDLCEAIHRGRGQAAPAKKNFRVWWNFPNGMRLCLPDDFLSSDCIYNYTNRPSVSF